MKQGRSKQCGGQATAITAYLMCFYPKFQAYTCVVTQVQLMQVRSVVSTATTRIMQQRGHDY
jgi:hypothetical protein